jgi:hypothetical protein
MKTKKLITLSVFFAVSAFANAFAQSTTTTATNTTPNPGGPNASATMPNFNFPGFPNFPTPSYPPNNYPNFPNNPTSSSTVRVLIAKYVNGTLATASSTNNASFNMSATYNTSNSGSGTASYVLGPSGTNGGNTPYQAMTIPLNRGAAYGTSEVINTTTGTSCVASTTSGYTPFALQGYSVGNTMNEAIYAPKSLTAPNFTNILNDKYVIVWNTRCGSNGQSGQIGGDVTGGASSTGVLAVTSIEPQNTNGVADNTFQNGFRYIFNITVPTNEVNFAMKFSDWMNTSAASATIPAASNIRISSAQASSTDPVVVSAANTYTSPLLTIIGDLDPVAIGRQIKVLIETKIPISTLNGSYTTTYGIRTQ